jgi:Skp family chaperone for outer membrane proteins
MGRAAERRHRLRAIARLAILMSCLSSPLLAQDQPAVILTLDQERFYVDSAFGKTSLERERAATEALEDENKRIEAELVAEEQALTELRKTLPTEEFAAKADAFDSKVERIRAEQDGKARLLAEGREKDRQEFLRAAIPVLGEVLAEKQAVAILDKTTVILSLSAIDVTDEAIAKVDAALAGPEPAAP